MESPQGARQQGMTRIDSVQKYGIKAARNAFNARYANLYENFQTDRHWAKRTQSQDATEDTMIELQWWFHRQWETQTEGAISAVVRDRKWASMPIIKQTVRGGDAVPTNRMPGYQAHREQKDAVYKKWKQEAKATWSKETQPPPPPRATSGGNAKRKLQEVAEASAEDAQERPYHKAG